MRTTRVANTPSTSAQYQFRLPAEEKAEVFAIFKNLGLKPAQAVRLFFGQVRATGGIPFAFNKTEEAAAVSTKTRVPNKETLKVFKESDAGIGWNYAKDAKDLFKQLGI